MIANVESTLAERADDGPAVVRYRSDSVFGNVQRQLRRGAAFARAGLSARRGSTPPGPIWAHIGPVRRCNYQCVMCPLYAPDAREEATSFLRTYPGDMPMDMARQLAEDLSRMGTITVEFIGNGEPLLHRHRVEFIETFRRRGLDVILYTNGSQLNRDIAKSLVELGVRYLRISINAGTPEAHHAVQLGREGDFEKILAGARAVEELRRRAGTKLPYMTYGFVLMEQNYRDAKQAVRHAAKARIDSIYFKPLMEINVAAKHAPEDDAAVEAALVEAGAEAERLGVHTNLGIRAQNPLEKDFGEASAEVYKRIGCYWPWLHTQIDADGHVYGCCQCQNVLGNLHEQDFAQIWTNSAYNEYRRRCSELPVLGQIPGCECNECVVASRNAVFHDLLHPFAGTEFGNGTSNIFRKIPNFVRMLRFKSV